MKMPENGMLLRIFIGEADYHDGKLLYEEIVMKAREMNLAGATVLKGIMGYGAHSRLHTTKLLRLSQDLPIIIEMVDSEENLQKILPFIEEVVTEGMITMERMHILQYREGEKTETE